MAREKNPEQVDRFDGKNSFLEVCLCLEIEKIRIGFRKYDTSQDKGSKITGLVDIFLSIREAGVLADKIMSRELQSTKPDQYGVLYNSSLGGGEVNGKTVSRRMKVMTGEKAPFRVMGQSGPGQRMENGLIQPTGKPETNIAILFTADDLIGFGMALQNAIARQNIHSGVAAMNALKEQKNKK